MKIAYFVPVFILIIMGCGRQSSYEMSEPAADLKAEASYITRLENTIPPPPEKTIIPESTEKKIIKDGQVGLKVEKLDKTKKHIDTLVKINNAYYANESFNNTDYESSFNLKIRIPSYNFEKFISAIESGEDEVVYKNINARDVTEEFIDLETRLKNKREYLKRYSELLKQAKTVKDILEIEEKTRVIEEEIESAEGRLKYLTNQVDFSTLDLTITKEKEFTFKPGKKGNYIERLKQSLSKGWYGFIDFSLFTIKLWPFWLIVAILVIVWRKIRRKNKKK